MADIITVERKDYDEMIQGFAKWQIMREAIKNAAKLDYSGRRLTFDGDMIDSVFAAIAPNEYNAVLDALQEDKKGGEF